MTDFSHLVREANLIGGAWVGADDGTKIDVTNPASGDMVARVPNAGAAETRRTIDAAHAALPAYAYTRDMNRIFRVQDQMQYGLLGINEVLIVTPEAPFGSIKASGMDREGGRQGIEDFLDLKYTCIRGL